METLIRQLNEKFKLVELALTASENDAQAGSANHVLLTDGDSTWHFPDAEATCKALEQALKGDDASHVYYALWAHEDGAVAGWRVNSLGGGDTYIGKEDEWPEVWEACGYDSEECMRDYLTPMAPTDWVYPRLGADKEGA